MRQLIQNGEYPTCPAVAKEFEISTRTVKRDVEFMKESLNLPIEYDRSRGGFFYTEPVEAFPTMAVTEAGSLRALRGAQSDRAVSRHAVPGTARGSVPKADGATGSERAVHLEQSGGCAFVPSVRAQDTDLAVFQTIARAIQERRALRFLYRNLGASKAQRRHVRPYHIACIENHWYVFAWDVDRGAMRTFVLTRFREPEATEERFTIPRKFSASEYLRDSFSAYKGNQDFRNCGGFRCMGR